VIIQPRTHLVEVCGEEAVAHLDGELAKEREGGAVSAKVIRLSDQEMDDLKELWAAMCQNSPDLRFIVRKDIRPESEGSMGQKCNRCFEKICLDEIFSRRCNRFPSVMPTGFHCPGIDQFSDRINNSSASKARRSTMELLMLHNMIRVRILLGK